MSTGLGNRKSNSERPTRELLIASAALLFTENGYASVSTRDIAEHAGVNLGSIQYYFGSKAKLFVEAVKRMMEHVGGSQIEVLFKEEVSSPEEAGALLGRFIGSFLSHLTLTEGPQPCRLMFREVFSGASQDPELYNELVDCICQEFTNPLLSALQQTIEKLKPGISSHFAQLYAEHVLGLCSFYFTHRPFLEAQGAHTQEELQEKAVHVVRFVLRGLGCESSLEEISVEGVLSTFTS